MRVVIVNQHPKDALGGSEIQCDVIARGLVQRGYDAVYVAVKGKGPYAGIPYKVVPVIESRRAILKTCLHEDPTIVYWRFGKSGFRYAAKMMRRRGLPIVFAISCISDTTVLPPLSRLRCAGARGIVKRTVISAWNHRGFKWVSGVTSLNPDYVGVVDTPKQTFIPNSMPSDRELFIWPRPYVVWVANIKAHKRPELCVNLAKVLATQGIDVLMIGAIQQNRYQWLWQAKQASSNLHYLGPRTVQQVNGILHGSLALVHTCITEGFGNNFIQAWLQGKPTVSFEFDPGGLIRKKGLGYVSQGDEERFHQQVLDIVNEPERAKRMGLEAQAWALSHHQEEGSVTKLIAFLNDVLNEASTQNAVV